MAKEKTLEDIMKEDAGLGLEAYDPAEENRIGFIKIVQKLSKEFDLGKGVGSLINGATKQTLAEEGDVFKFIPLYYFKDYSIWDKKKFTLIKRSLNKADFTDEELAWHDRVPPTAQESLNFVVLNAADPTIPMILSFTRTNVKQGQEFRILLSDKMTTENIPTFGGIYSIRTVEEKNASGKWSTFASAKFVEKVTDVELYTKLRGYHKEISAINFNVLLGGGSEASKAIPEATATIDSDAKY